MTSKVRHVWAVVHCHEHGTDVRLMQYVRTAKHPYPDPAKVVEAMGIDFEPEKGETVELILADDAQPSFTAAQVGGKQPPSVLDDGVGSDEGQMTHWICPECKATIDVPADELAEVGTPLCTECDDDGVEMELAE